MKGSNWAKLLLAAGVLTGLMAIFALSNATAAKPEKITICHATGSESNPYVANTVSFSSGDYEAALEKSGHFDGDGETEIGHEDDFILPFHGTKEDCVASPSPSPPPPSPSPTGV